MTTDRLPLIRRKNVASYRWLRGVIECHKRRKRGSLPATWLARLAELEAVYREALAAVKRLRGCCATHSDHPRLRRTQWNESNAGAA